MATTTGTMVDTAREARLRARQEAREQRGHRANALVIDRRKGWRLEYIKPELMKDTWRKYLYGRNWYPVVIRNYNEKGEVSYHEPVLPRVIASTPENLYLALVAIKPYCKRLFQSGPSWLKGLRIATQIAFLAVLAVIILLVWGTVTGH